MARPTDEDIRKLPQWAQHKITNLEARVKELSSTMKPTRVAQLHRLSPSNDVEPVFLNDTDVTRLYASKRFPKAPTFDECFDVKLIRCNRYFSRMFEPFALEVRSSTPPLIEVDANRIYLYLEKTK